MHMLFKQAIIQDIPNSKELKLTQEIIDEARGKAKQAIQQELLKAQWEIVNIAKQRAKDDDVYTLDAFAEDMNTYLQAKLKGDDK